MTVFSISNSPSSYITYTQTEIFRLLRTIFSMFILLGQVLSKYQPKENGNSQLCRKSVQKLLIRQNEKLLFNVTTASNGFVYKFLTYVRVENAEFY